MAVSAGGVAAVRVTVATLWSSPGAVRPADEAALGPNPDIAAWVAGMSPEQRLDSGVLSQLPLGERVLVDEVRPDGWARVVALDQPAAARDPRGYPGWLPVDQVSGAATAEPNGHGAWLVVDAPVTDLWPSPPARSRCPAWWSAPGSSQPARRATTGGRCACPARPRRSGARRPTRPRAGRVARAAEQALAVAQRLLRRGLRLGRPVRARHRLLRPGAAGVAAARGPAAPRRHDQAAATTDVPLGEERPGDLYFFARPGQPIHHVGIVTAGDGGGCCTPATRPRQVVEEPLPDGRGRRRWSRARPACAGQLSDVD